MPEIKANEALPERPVIAVIFGDPGIGKSSLAATCAKPYTIDFDKGISRASRRGDALIPNNWEEVLEHEKKGTFKKYSTVVIDTAKACLDDFLMTYVVNQDYKNKKNKQAAYGALGDEFKIFISNRRIDSSDILIIAHAKDKEDGDLTKKIPDVTGGSYQLLLRVADQIGFMTTRNNRRVIQFEPTDYSIGKNVAKLPIVEVPDENDPAFRHFMADIIQNVKDSIRKESDAQKEATQLTEKYQTSIQACETPDCLTDLLKEVNTLPDFLKAALRQVVQVKAKEKGWIPNKETLRYEAPAGEPVKPAANNGKPPTGLPASEESDLPEDLDTAYDDRCHRLAELGLNIEIDQFTGFGLSYGFKEVGDWTEDQYIDAVARLNSAKKTHNKNGTKKGRAAATANAH